jgi:NADH:ubiquinone oxidoreductase subunit 4 (subunit M)
MISFPWITTLTAVPLVGAIAVLALSGKNKSLVRWTALAFSLISLLLTLILWHKFNTLADGFQFQELHTWIPSLNVDYRVGIDGLGLRSSCRLACSHPGRLNNECPFTSRWFSYFRHACSAPSLP